MCRMKRKSQLWRKNINIVNLGLVICSKHDVPGDGRHEGPWIRLKDSCKRKQSRFLMNQEASLKTKRSRERLWMREENGVYVLDVYVAPPDRHLQQELGKV